MHVSYIPMQRVQTEWSDQKWDVETLEITLKYWKPVWLNLLEFR
jgi:hypothetical protein